MIEILNMPADHIIGMKVEGKIEKDDIVPVIEAIKPKFDQYKQIAVYVEMPAWEGISLSALWEDLKFGLPHLKVISKKAVVTDKAWVTHAVEWADMLFPGIEAKTFEMNEKEAALDWLSED